MAAYLRLVVATAERSADELAAERARDRLAERSLADTRWPDETQDRRMTLHRIGA